jgi:hypothetical protein
MKHSISQIGGSYEYQVKVNHLSPEEYILITRCSIKNKEAADKLKARIRKEIIKEAGGAIRTTALGKIGNGKKVHRLMVSYIELTDFRGKGIFYLSAYDGCGSSKWNCWSPSSLYVLGEYDEKMVTCLKCIKK